MVNKFDTCFKELIKKMLLLQFSECFRESTNPILSLCPIKAWYERLQHGRTIICISIFVLCIVFYLLL